MEIEEICIFWEIKEANSKTEKVAKCKIKLGLPFIVPDLFKIGKQFY
jgi:hypothetical protein